MDWIDSFCEDTQALAPMEFRTWTGIGVIAAALERRVYIYSDKGILYPNLYTLLTGGPGSGKSLMVNQAREFIRAVPELHIGPDNPTRRSFLDCLQKSTRTFGLLNGADSFTMYQAMFVASRELGVLISKYDAAFINDLSDIYDNPDRYSAPRASTTDVTLEKPTVNILGAVTPDLIGEIFPDVAWWQGLTSRLLLIYGSKIPNPRRNIFDKFIPKSKQNLSQSLEIISVLSGESIWTSAAQDASNDWINEGMPPAPTYEKLRYYCERRDSHVLKLSIIAAVSRTGKLTVELEDFTRARQWLTTAEEKMPDVFRAMNQKNDVQQIKDLHYHFWSVYSSSAVNKRVAIPKDVIWDWLTKHTTSDKIPKLFDAAVNAGYFAKSPIYPDHWIPKRLDQAGDIL